MGWIIEDQNENKFNAALFFKPLRKIKKLKLITVCILWRRILLAVHSWVGTGGGLSPLVVIYFILTLTFSHD